MLQQTNISLTDHELMLQYFIPQESKAQSAFNTQFKTNSQRKQTRTENKKKDLLKHPDF